MILNYLKISFRNLLKYKVFSIINILGLSIGISAFMLIMIYVRYEFSFDKFHKNSKNLYRIQANWYSKAGVLDEKWALTSPGVALDMKAEFPEVKYFTRILFDIGYTIVEDDFKYKCEKLHFVDPHFFQMFSNEFRSFSLVFNFSHVFGFSFALPMSLNRCSLQKARILGNQCYSMIPKRTYWTASGLPLSLTRECGKAHGFQ